MQYISVGNIATHDQVSLILIDYPARTRLKIYAKAAIIELDDDSGLYETLDLEDYQFKPERMMTFEIQAYDWNCPQHITPRYTLEEIQEVFSSQREEILRLQKENNALRAKSN
jgi:predicted pyridoxine 5'-phosphate oxidase superfamily flavin-nucleotide-binding protein